MNSLAAGVCCPAALPGSPVLYAERVQMVSYAVGMLEVFPRVAVFL